MNKLFKVWLKSTVLAAIRGEGLDMHPLETGGILIGYKTEDSQYVITDSISAGPKAIHKPNSFTPDHKFQKKEITKLYELSNGTETYLGDWHTHPNSHPYLSSTDLDTFNRIAKFKRARIQFPLMLVAAPPDNEFKIWIYQPTQVHVLAEVYLY